jgi:DNA polymerase delta subunit 2
METRPLLESTVKKNWGDVSILKLMDIIPGVQCCVLGTLFKVMPLKPSILKEISEEHGLNPLPLRKKFTSEDDSLVLEDESQRITLTGAIPTSISVTGTVIAVIGQELSSGKFDVEKYTYCGIPPQTSISVDSCLEQGEDRYVLLVSGLGIGSTSRDPLALQLLVDTVIGHLGGPQDRDLCSKIGRVIVAGNVLCEETKIQRKDRNSKFLTRKVDAVSVDAVKELDDVLAQLAACVPVDVMPGASDPANYILPQQPFQPCMFPEAAQYPTLRSVTNPYEAVIGGVRFLGTSGQTVNDIYQFSDIEDRMDILEHTLVCSHLAPTAPDTLGCFPYFQNDPFVITECPHVYFAGNQPCFQSRIVCGNEGQKSLLVLIPDFSQTSSSVLVNLRTLECQQVSVGCDFRSKTEHELWRPDGAESMDES